MLPLRTHILAALPALQEKASRCMAPGVAGPSPVVQLIFETLAGEIRVAEAAPEPPGLQADPRAACAAEQVRGMSFPAPPAVAGFRFRYPLQVAPRPAG